MTNFWYKPNGTELLKSQPLWEDDTMSAELPVAYQLPKKAGQDDLGLRYTAGQQWNSDSLWPPPMQPMLTQRYFAGMAADGSAYADPGLSSHSTSRRSSINPPFTPDTNGSASKPTRQSFLSSNDTGYISDCFMYPNHQTGARRSLDAVATADQSFIGLQFSTPTYHSDALECPMAGETWLNAIQEQSLENSFSPISQPSWQQGTTAPPHWSASERQSNQRNGTLAETWQTQENSTSSLCDKDVLPCEASGPAGYDPVPTISFHTWDNGTNDTYVEPDNISLYVRIKSAAKEEYPSVQCEQCGNVYTGRYGTGNMHRHVRLKHAHELQKEYICNVCKKTYNRSDALRNHERQKHLRLWRASATKRFPSQLTLMLR